MGKILSKKRVMLLLGIFLFSLSVSSAQKVSANYTKTNLKTVLESISKQTGYTLWHTAKRL